jgi:hypothetical protein
MSDGITISNSSYMNLYRFLCNAITQPRYVICGFVWLVASVNS